MTLPSTLRLKSPTGEKNNPIMPLSLRPKQAVEKKESLQEQSTPEYISRTAGAAGTGYASGTPFGLATNLSNFLAMGDVYDPEEIERIRAIAEREGVPFDEEKYLEAGRQALGSFPTPSNLARMAEEATGLPLTPKDRFQKGIEFATTAGKIAPQPGTFRGMNTSLPKPILGAGVAATKEVLQEAGLPEPISEAVSFAILKIPTKGAGSISIGQAKKPSGLTERRFENTNQQKTISENRLDKINQAVEMDFREISDKIIKESPIGNTAENLLSNPAYKQESRELLNQAQEIADSIPGSVASKSIKKELADIAAKQTKGYAPNEYDKSYMKFMKESIEDIASENVTHGQLVKQYRKNNDSLSEYFEPGSSKALNRAKRDSLLDNNRAIANIIEKTEPELAKVFKDGNARWSKIMDAEAVDSFVNEVFSEKINYKKLHDFFDENGYDRIFKRALGEKGFKDFELLVKDMLTTETPYKMLKVAKAKGFDDLFRAGMAYIVHPKLGIAKATYDTTKNTFRAFMNSLLDKPKLGIQWKKGIQDLKKGNFSEAEKIFSELEKETSHPSEFPRNAELQEPKLPKLIEYKPKNSTPKERINTLSRSSFKNAINGKKISSPEKTILKNTQVSLLQTRGKGQQFHGTKSPIKNLNNDIFSTSNEQNIYGAGFYTTDALDIADGYSKFGNKKELKKPTVYHVIEKKPQKIYDAEKSFEEFKKWWTRNATKDLEKSNYILDEIIHAENPVSVRDFYDKIREYVVDEGLPAYEAQDYFSEIQHILEEKGYDGISHKGGMFTKNPEHTVKIYWKPENLEIQEFFYPEFKKVNKTAKFT